MKVRKVYANNPETEWDILEEEFISLTTLGVCTLKMRCNGCPFHVVLYDGSTSCTVTSFYRAGHKLEAIE